MNNRIALILLLLLFFFSRDVFSENPKNDVTWAYEKVSDVDIFNKHDSNVVKNLNTIYSKVTISTKDKKLNIKNELRGNGNVCSIDYVNVIKTPLSYFLSRKTVSMYEKLFTHEGIHLSNSLSILESVYPDKSCPPPYDELIRNDERLIVLDQNYILFFKEIKTSVNVDATSSKMESLSTYCHNDKAKYVYDGTFNYICVFRGPNLRNAYNKLRELNEFSREYMKEGLPIKNDEYEINESTVSYQWDRVKSLNVSVVMSSEVNKYLFNEKLSGTWLEISGATQY